MKMRVFVVSIVLSLILAAFVGCGGPGERDSGGDKKETAEKAEKDGVDKKDKKDKKDKEDTDAVPVQVVSPRIGDISSFLLFSSNIDSEKVVDIFPMTMGIIESIKFDEGQYVKKGDILAVLDDREASLNEQKAGKNYQKLKAEFQRQKEIFERQMLSKEEFERLRYNMEAAELEWKQAKLLLSYTRITTPIGGVVTKRYIKVGNKINSSQMAFSVVQDKEKIAVVNIPEQEKNSIYKNQDTLILAGEQQVPGFVKRISPAIDPDSGTFKVTVAVNDREGIYAVGQFVTVKVIKKVHRGVILLTKDSIVREGGKAFVFIINDKNEALKKAVKLDFEDGNTVEVTEGVSATDRVVTGGKSSLKNKTLVKIIEPVVS